MKDKIKNLDKKGKILVGIITGTIIVAIIAIILLFIFKDKNERDLQKSLEQMGRDFYEDYYYENLFKDKDEKTKFLERYTTIGIKVDLENLSRYNSQKNSKEVEKFVNKKTDTKCNMTETKVIIYPQKPFKRNSYKIETILSCGFDKEENKK